MAITLVASTYGHGGGSGGSTSSAIDTTGANFIVVSAVRDNSSSITVSDNKGNTPVTSLTGMSRTNSTVKLYYFLTPTVGTGHTFTVAGGASYSSIAVLAFAGVHATAPFDEQNGAGGGSGATFACGSVVPGYYEEVIITAVTAEEASGTRSIDSGFTKAVDVSIINGVSYGSFIGYKIKTDATAENPIWTTSTGSCPWAGVNATFRSATGAPAFDLLSGLVSYWKLDESSGNALDAHGSNDLTDVNTVGTAAGKINTSRDFELDNAEYFSRTSGASLSTGDIDFTFSLWARAESLPAGNSVLFAKWADSLGTYELILFHESSSNLFQWYVRSSASGLANSRADNFGAPPLNTWMHFICWHDSVNNQLGISINGGTPNISGCPNGADALTSMPFLLGAYDTGIKSWDGQIDEVGFWKKRLITAERLALYNNGDGFAYPFSAGPPPDPLLLAVTN